MGKQHQLTEEASIDSSSESESEKGHKPGNHGRSGAESDSSSDKEQSGTSASGPSVADSYDERSLAEREVHAMAKSATQKIACARAMTFFLILVTGVMVAFGTYFILDLDESDKYIEGVCIEELY